jgi:hypothetical protein
MSLFDIFIEMLILIRMKLRRELEGVVE